MKNILMLYLCLFPGVLLAADDHHAEHGHEHHDHAGFEQHGAHVHGLAELLVAQEGSIIEITLSSPAVNLVGFEHPPHSAAEQRALADTVAILRDGAGLLVLPKAAVCKLQNATVESALLGNGDGEAESEHADFDVSYRFYCANPQAVKTIDVRLFDRFSGLQHMRAVILSDHGQVQTELDADRHVLSL